MRARATYAQDKNTAGTGGHGSGGPEMARCWKSSWGRYVRTVSCPCHCPKPSQTAVSLHIAPSSVFHGTWPNICTGLTSLALICCNEHPGQNKSEPWYSTKNVYPKFNLRPQKRRDLRIRPRLELEGAPTLSMGHTDAA